jgi:hypothetical protein
VVNHGAGGIQRLDFNILFAIARAILAEQQPGQGIVYAGFASGVIALDGGIATAQLQSQVPVALEIVKGEPHNLNRAH